MALTQSQMIAAVADRAEISRADAKRALDALDEIVLEELGNAQKLRLGGVVQLTVRVKPAQKKRRGRNPATGEQPTPGGPWQIRITPELRHRVCQDAPEGWLTLRDAATALGVARQTVLHKVQRGELPAVYVQRGRRKGLRIQVKPIQTGLSTTPEERRRSAKPPSPPPGGAGLCRPSSTGQAIASPLPTAVLVCSQDGL